MVQATVPNAATTANPGPGSLFVTPAGWRGSWTIYEPLRKMWVIQNLSA